MTNSPVAVGIAIPQIVPDGSFDPAAMRDYLAAAEDFGFGSAWTGEQVLGTSPLLAPLETMAYAAACTQRLRLGCAMLVSSLHNPVQLAKAIASVDQLSRGRIDVGLVAGGPRRMFSAFDADPKSYLARFCEGRELMVRLWTQPRVDFDGRCWQLRDAALEPKPYQKPHPPLWLGGSHPDAVRRAVRLGSGFIAAGTATTESFAGQVALARARLRRDSRDPAEFTIGKRVYISVDDDADRARSRLAAEIEARYGYFGLENLAASAVAGTPEDCIAGLRAVRTAGADLIILDPLGEDPQQLRRLATEVVPGVA